MSDQPTDTPFAPPLAPPAVASTPTAPPRMAPPIVPGALAAPKRESSWPIPIGIVTMVLAVGSLLTSVWFMVGEAMFSGGLGWSHWRAPHVIMAATMNGIGALLAILAFVAGLMLLSRRPWTRAGLMCWALAKIALIGLALVANPETIWQDQDPFFVVMQLAPSAFACTLPTFILIWFTRRGIRTTVDSWKYRPATLPAVS